MLYLPHMFVVNQCSAIKAVFAAYMRGNCVFAYIARLDFLIDARVFRAFLLPYMCGPILFTAIKVAVIVAYMWGNQI